MDDLCYGELEPYTYDAMWCKKTGHRVEVPDIRPDGEHRHSKFRNPNPTPKMEHTKMTEPTPTDLPFDMDDARRAAKLAQDKFENTTEDIRAKAQEALPNPLPPQVEQAKNFFQANQALIVTAVTVVVLAKLNKRMIRKVVSKEIVKGLATTPVLINLPAYMSDVDAYYAAKDAAAWAHTTAVQ